MKKSIFFFIIFALFCTFSYAQKGFEAKFSQPSNTEYQVTFSVTDWSLQNAQFDGVNYAQIVFNSSTVTQEKGWAELPFISASIQLPAQKNVDIRVIHTEYTDYQLEFPLVPSRGVIYRNQDPTTIPYEIAPASIVNRFYPEELATADEPYIIRDVRGTSVRVFPFQYNAATNTLRVYSKMEVLLTENNEPATNPLLVENPNPLREMRGTYKSIFLNYAEPKIPLVMAQHGEILVITTARDAETIDTYIQWKQEKGFIVHKEIVATGTNVKTLIQQKYNANNNILYVQLVGDWADIKSDLGGGASAPTDPKMGCVVGTDNFPEIAIGRFSCSNATQLTTQIDKAIQYEKDPDMGGWYSSFIGMGSNDTGPADDGEKDWLHIQRIYSQRLEPTYNYNTHYRLYENESGCTAANLTNYINNGASTIGYCGHGSATSFVTTGFSNSHVNNLTNGNKLPFIVSVACVNGAFHNGSDCFAEAWLKKQNGGALVTWMSTINQPWAEPMRGQDYFYDILCGGFNYSYGQYGIVTEELRTTWGSIVVNAGNLMLTESQGSGDVYTLHTWTTFGDASVQLRTKQPAVLEVAESPLAAGMPFTTTITANGEPVKDALVCISQNDVYISAFTDENGEVSIENEFIIGEALVVVTAFNTTTHYATIEVTGSLELPEPINLTSNVENANHVVLSWEEPEDKGLTVKGYKLYRDETLITLEPITQELTFTDIVPQNGEYEYVVTAVYGTTLESESSNTISVVVDGMCIPISNHLTLEEKADNNILVSWVAPTYEGLELAGYNIYRNDEQLNTEIIPATQLSFLDEAITPSTQYCYQVEVVYNDCAEPLKTEKECTILSVRELFESQFSLYPNPTNGELRITNYELGITNVEIYDAYGKMQKVENKMQKAEGELVMNISDLAAGIYFVKIYTETGKIAVKRVVLKK
ncbi:MAG: C25 family cysteine peptidase [Lentimicrobiaceae bacterium]|nr:C25 family cysteine peptidase [Lentimicrobiaceae bacterium]